MLNPLILLTIFSIWNQVNSQTAPSCDSLIYCQGDLLDVIQKAELYEDSKTFVDLQMLYDADTILQNFYQFMNNSGFAPTSEQVRAFVNDNFQTADEFIPWLPSDFNPEPALLDKIIDPDVREFAKNVISIWLSLSRKIKPEIVADSSRYSILPASNGFIVPGGRFREFHYWDSYWIIRGLLLSDLKDTARGMIENFAFFIDRYGHIPNGARLYFLKRSQPPSFVWMLSAYFEATRDFEFLRQNIIYLEKEMEYWLTEKTTSVIKDGMPYILAHYDVESGSPRPESYIEDLRSANELLNDDDRIQLYANLKTAAESGWDFSSRWMFDQSGGVSFNISTTQTRRIIPVDLNALLCKSFKFLSDFYIDLGDIDSAIIWFEKFATWQKAIALVFYDEGDGIWYDYDSELKQPRKNFYPSNFSPLWTQCHLPIDANLLGQRAAEYFQKQGIMEFQGGIPTSLLNTSQQWDYPDAWPPLQGMVVFGLENTGNALAKSIAKEFAQRWVTSTMKGYADTKLLYEKYSAIVPGKYGDGGEYEPQAGFGWTNGVTLQFINHYFTEKSDDYYFLKKNV